MPEILWTTANIPDINHPALSQDNLTAIATDIKQKYRTWKQNRLSLEECWKEIDRQVNQYDPFYSPGERMEFGVKGPTNIGVARSRVKTPATYSHREGLTATLVQNQFKNDLDFFDLAPLDPNDEDVTNDYKAYLTYVLDMMSLPEATEIFTRTLVHYGTAIASVQWYREEYPRWRKLRMKDPETGELITVPQVSNDVTYNAPRVTTLDNYYTVIDPSNPNVRTSTLIMLKAMSCREIADTQHYASFCTYDWVKENGTPFSSNIDIDDEQERDATLRQENDPGEKYGDKIAVYEAWGDFYDGERFYKNYVAEVIGDTVVRFEPNPTTLPHKPFIIARTNLQANSVYGTSILYPVVGIQASMDTIMNQYIDSNTIRTNRPWEVDLSVLSVKRNGPGGQPDLPPMSMNSVFFTNGGQAITRANVGSDPLDNAAPTIIAALQTMMERATGDSELLSGGDPSQYMKTGVAMQAVNAGTTRLNLYAKTLESAIEDMLIIVCDLLRLNALTETSVVTDKKVDDSTPSTFDAALLQKNFRFTMRGASYNIVKQTQTSNFLQALQMAGQNPVLMQAINWVECARIMFEQLDIRNVSRLFLPQAFQMSDQMRMQAPTFQERIMSLFSGQNAKKQRETNMPQQAGGGAVQQNVPGVEGGQVSPFAA